MSLPGSGPGAFFSSHIFFNLFINGWQHHNVSE
jgi:hypothetical protein